MSGREQALWRRLLERMGSHSALIFGLLSGLIVLLIAAVIVGKTLDDGGDPLLPIEFRLTAKDLSELPVHIDQIQSCSCWFGPRDEAQRKYKFRVVNNTDRVLNIGGGPRSSLRLIVAYPNDRTPRLTMPVPSGEEFMGQLESPPDIRIPISDRIARVRANRIKGSNEFLGVPSSYSVWALPPSTNKLAELVYGRTDGSYPTVVDKTHLLPGEEYSGDQLGHGTWTFYIPLPHRFASRFEFGFEPILPRRAYERHVVFVGVAAFKPNGDELADLLGFVPAPSENALAFPSEL